jgi:hypothetical protein
MLKYFSFILVITASSAYAMNPTTNTKIDEALSQCVQNFDHSNDRMACIRIALTWRFCEKEAEIKEHDSECVKICKKDLTERIARIQKYPHDETFSPIQEQLFSEKQAKFLKEQFLTCMEVCNNGEKLTQS